MKPWRFTIPIQSNRAVALCSHVAALLILCASSFYAHGPISDSTERILVTSAVVATGAFDWGSTVVCLRAGTCREANPALQWAVMSGETAFGLTKAVSTGLIAYLTHWLYTHGHRTWARVVGIGASATWGTAALLNLRSAPPVTR